MAFDGGRVEYAWPELRPYPFYQDRTQPFRVLAERIEKLGSDPDVSAKLARSVAHSFRYAWMQAVQTSALGPDSKAAYRKGMGHPKRQGDLVIIDLRGWLAVHLEIGADPFDYGGQTLANSPRTKISKDGNYYVDVRLKDYEPRGPGDEGWRRISSKPGKWKPTHPGLEARAFAQGVDVNAIVQRSLAKQVKKLLGSGVGALDDDASVVIGVTFE